jgi:hypothetical protein
MTRLSRFTLALTVLAAASARAQQAAEKKTTATGNVVAVYAIVWPNPTTPVSADVEVCAAADAAANLFAFPSFFQLRFADGDVIGSAGSLKKPAFEKTPLKPKQCARGWLDFVVTAGQRPVAIRYRDAGADKKPIEWAVK